MIKKEKFFDKVKRINARTERALRNNPKVFLGGAGLIFFLGQGIANFLFPVNPFIRWSFALFIEIIMVVRFLPEIILGNEEVSKEDMDLFNKEMSLKDL